MLHMAMHVDRFLKCIILIKFKLQIQFVTGASGKWSSWFPPGGLVEPSAASRAVSHPKRRGLDPSRRMEKAPPATPRNESRKFVPTWKEPAPRLGESAGVEAPEQLAPAESRIALEPEKKALRVMF